MIDAMHAQTPNATALTPTECGLRGMINECLTYMAGSATGELCVTVLITDGTPTQCDTDQSNLAAIVADGLSRGVLTFALALPGADLNSLNTLAQAGGTNAAHDVSGGAQAFVDALNNIRQTISNSMTTVVMTPTVIETALPCEWRIPVPPTGQVLDPSHINFQATIPGGATISFGFVPSGAACSRVTEPAWYFDDPAAPTKILLCPSACLAIRNSPQASADVLIGCPTRYAM
jgi:hypothetical protein